MFFQLFHGSNKLNRYIINEDWSAVTTHIESHPRDAKVWTTRIGFFDGENDSHVLPLHQACALHAPRDTLDALILAYPQATQSRETSFRRLPIHISCQNGATSDVIELLLSYYPEGAHAQDTLGRYPIHYACSNGASLSVVDALLASHPRSAAHADIHGWLPIHVACHMGARTEVIQRLFNAYPNAVDKMTDRGSTPLKLTNKINCRNKEEIVKILDKTTIGQWKQPTTTNIPLYNGSYAESNLRQRPFNHAA
mmetsp:Transcript_23989/g.30595  ORF Transcript_23989/g.30595 Transcript_23989/m.30595 type:complete len:253 (+) Transcript_23989:57-815(+)